jgi:hypothetical protein
MDPAEYWLTLFTLWKETEVMCTLTTKRTGKYITNRKERVSENAFAVDAEMNK